MLAPFEGIRLDPGLVEAPFFLSPKIQEES